MLSLNHNQLFSEGDTIFFQDNIRSIRGIFLRYHSTSSWDKLILKLNKIKYRNFGLIIHDKLIFATTRLVLTEKTQRFNWS